MKIGLTYDLRDDYLKAGFSEEDAAEFDSADTIDAIEAALQANGFATDRIGTILSLAQRLSTGERWDAVFNFAEGAYGTAREAQVPALLDAARIPYTFSGPLVLALTLDKGVTKHMLAAEGIPTPPFALIRTEADLDRLALPYPLFAKPVAEGTGKGISPESRVTTPAECRARCRELLKRFAQPVLIETWLPGREFTVGLLGSGRDARAIGVLEITPKKPGGPFVYSYENKHHCLERLDYTLVGDAEAQRAQDLALAAWRTLGCLDAGRIDLRSDAGGNPHVLEANPLAGLNPEVGDLAILARRKGMSHTELIGEIMRACLARHGLKWPQAKRRA